MGEGRGGRGDGRSANMTIRQSFVGRSMRTFSNPISYSASHFRPEEVWLSLYLQIALARTIGSVSQANNFLKLRPGFPW